LYSHRNYGKEYSTTDMSIASEKMDREFRDAYVEAEKKLSDKKNVFEAMAGMQLKREPQMVSGNVPMEHSGLNIAPERFNNFGETPGSDAKDNLKNYKSNPDITPMKFAKTKTSKEMLDMLRDADAMSLAIKTQATMGDGDSVGIDNLSKIRAAKTFLVESLRIKTAEYHDFSDKINGMDLKDVMKDLLEGDKRGLSYKEMASELNITEEEVESILQRRDEYPENLLQEEFTAEDKISEIDQRLRSIIGE